MSGQESSRMSLRETQSLCTICVQVVPARVELRGTSVWMSKRCPEHGEASFKLSDDAPYTLGTLRPLTGFAWRHVRQSGQGCPADCGPCEGHLTAAGAVIVELTNACNLPCSTCIAGSDSSGRAYASIRDIKRSIEGAIARQGEVPILMLSGGEPTIHPLFMEILTTATSYSEVGHVMVISNGKRISEESEFALQLAERFPDVEIYLQFDSLDPSVLKALRGLDLSEMRQGALQNLSAAGLSTSLVVLTNGSVNLHEAGSVVDFAMTLPHVRGVTFQPIRATGRHDAFDYEKDGTTLTDVRTALLAQTDYFDKDGLAPHPLSPESIAVAYVRRSTHEVVTDEVNAHIAASRVPPLFWVDQEAPSDLFRVAVVCFYDRVNFCTEGVRSSLVQFALQDGRLVPLDTYYLFHESPTYAQPNRLALPIAR